MKNVCFVAWIGERTVNLLLFRFDPLFICENHLWTMHTNLCKTNETQNFPCSDVEAWISLTIIYFSHSHQQNGTLAVICIFLCVLKIEVQENKAANVFIRFAQRLFANQCGFSTLNKIQTRYLWIHWNWLAQRIQRSQRRIMEETEIIHVK